MAVQKSKVEGSIWDKVKRKERDLVSQIWFSSAVGKNKYGYIELTDHVVNMCEICKKENRRNHNIGVSQGNE